MKLFILTALLLIAITVHAAETNGLPNGQITPAENRPIDPVAKAKNAPVSRLSSLATGMEWVGKAVDEPEYYVWCASPIMGDDKKVHLFCARWPKKPRGMAGWESHCEIAHYVADRPEGPFTFVNIAIAARPGAAWNNSVHNPSITRVGKKFVLLYITFDHRKDSPYLAGDTPPCGKMYTCMATADSLDGPWTLQGKEGMIVFPSSDPKHWSYQSWSLDNPTFLAHDGKFYIYIKVGKHQRQTRYGYAVADKLEGPYTMSDEPCTDNIDYTEDAYAFIWNDRFYLLSNDNYGTHTGASGRGILWQSDTPTKFRLADASIGFLKIPDYCPKLDLSKARNLYTNDFKFERPAILMIDGKPAYFYGSCGMNLEGADHSCSYVMKINQSK